MGSYALNCDVTGHSKADQRAIKTLEQTTRLRREGCEVGILRREDLLKLPNNFYFAMGQFESLERRLQKQDTLGKTLSGNQPLTLTSKLVLSEVEEHELNEPETCFNLYCHIVPSSALIKTTRKSQKSMKSSREVSSCALNDKILLGTGLLQSLIIIIFGFHENQIELSADIEGMFLQVVVSCDEIRCLRFLLIEKLEQIIKVYEYTH